MENRILEEEVKYMKNGELEELVKRGKEGDQEALHLLMDKYKPLILKLASKYRIPSYEFEDVVQYGYLTLIKAIKMYKLESNSFNGYVIRAIRNNILDLFKKNVKLYNEINDDRVLNICIDKELTVEEHILAGEEIKRLYKVLDKLSEDEKKIINDYYFNNKTLKTIACENNLNYKKIVKDKKRVLERMKNNY